MNCTNPLSMTSKKRKKSLLHTEFWEQPCFQGFHQILLYKIAIAIPWQSRFKIRCFAKEKQLHTTRIKHRLLISLDIKCTHPFSIRRQLLLSRKLHVKCLANFKTHLLVYIAPPRRHLGVHRECKMLSSTIKLQPRTSHKATPSNGWHKRKWSY